MIVELLRVGSTGTQRGTTAAQKATVMSIVTSWMPQEWHHGDCVGADEEVHRIVHSFAPECKLVGHPPANSAKRAFCKFDTLLPALPYLERNHNIVDQVDALVATPGEEFEVLRSGTWATVRYAIKLKIPTYIIVPSGLLVPYSQVRMV